jgi:hypothetical protein
MAQNLQQSFLTETQDTANSTLTAGHQTPKTLAIVDTTAYTEFIASLESLSLDLTSRLDAVNDPALIKILSRARGQTLSFEGYIDFPGALVPSAMDIGQFFEQFNSLCNIDPASSLKTLMANAQSAYDAMFVVRGVGPGTANATGMAVLWPYLRLYQSNPLLYDEYLSNSSAVATPNWLDFLATYYVASSTTLVRNTTTSVCMNNIENQAQLEYEGQLLLAPDVEVDAQAATFTSEVIFETDYVTVEYGINVTHLLSDRRLKEIINSQKQMESGRGLSIDLDSFDSVNMRHRYESRRTQSTNDFYYIYGGNVQVDYSLIKVQATWDRKFYYLSSNFGETLTALYVVDKGNGQKSFPVCYFPPQYRVTPEGLEGYSVQLAVLLLGCIRGEVAFSEESESLTLYVTNSFGTLSEMPNFAGGQIAPIAYVGLYTNDVYVTEFVGSFPRTVLNWSPFTDMSLQWVYDDVNLDIFGPETTALVYSIAYDFDEYAFDNITETYTGRDAYLYEYYVIGSSSRTPTPIESTPPVIAPVQSPISGGGPVVSPGTPTSGDRPVEGTPVAVTPPTPAVGRSPVAVSTNGGSPAVGAPTIGIPPVPTTGTSNGHVIQIDFYSSCWSVFLLLASWFYA